MNIAVIGSGIFGLSIANMLSNCGNNVTVWTEQEDTSKVLVPKSIKVTNDFKVCLEGAKHIYVLTAAKYTESIFENIKPYINDDMTIILGSKGILENGQMIEEVLKKTIPNVNYAILAGPTFAIDVSELEPIGFTIATKKNQTFDEIAQTLNSVKLDYSKDTFGTELCGVLKNAYAIGSGILEGFNYGPSTRCLYITEVLKEIKSILSKLKCDSETTDLLCGVGDLILTCTSLNSRNFTLGSIIGLGKKKGKDKFLETNTVEGYENLKILYKLFQEKRINTPILNTLYDIVINDAETNKIIDIIIK